MIYDYTFSFIIFSSFALCAFSLFYPILICRVFEIIDQNKEERSKRALLALTNDTTTTGAADKRFVLLLFLLMYSVMFTIVLILQGAVLKTAQTFSSSPYYFILTPSPTLLSCSNSSLTKLDAAAHEIHLENLSFAYASRPTTAVLSHLNLTLKPRSIACIVGKSGAGKSTLVGVLGGLLQPTAGCVRVGNEIVVAARENDMQVQILFGLNNCKGFFFFDFHLN